MNILKDIINDIIEENESKWSMFDANKSLYNTRFVSNARIPLIPSLLSKESNQHDKAYLIAEIKRASPSLGIIKEHFSPLEIAQSYIEGGADAISILTEENYFKGVLLIYNKYENILSTLPYYEKIFIIHPYQVYEAYIYGADIVLLIVAALDDNMLAYLYKYVEQYGMTALVEVHSKEEIERALRINPKLIGINNRDLNTFKVDLQTSFSLSKYIPKEIKVIAESGIFNSIDISLLRAHGILGILVGQSLLESNNIKNQIKKLKE